jgi:hypothetical protein
MCLHLHRHTDVYLCALCNVHPFPIPTQIQFPKPSSSQQQQQSFLWGLFKISTCIIAIFALALYKI